MEDLQRKDLNIYQSRQASTELPDGDGVWTYGNGSNSSGVSFNEQTRKVLSSDEFIPSNEHSVGHNLKMATSFLQSICLGDSSVILPVHLQIAGGTPPKADETPVHPFIVPSSSTISMPLVLEQQVLRNLNSQFPATIRSCPFVLNTLNSVTNQPQHATQAPENMVHNPNVTMFQSPGFSTALQDLPIPNNYSPLMYQKTGPNQTMQFAPNFVPPETVQSLHGGSPVTSLVPPATLLVPYPVVVPLPVPVPIPIPIPIPFQIPQSSDLEAFIKTGFTMNKTTQTFTEDVPTVHCCSSDLANPILPQFPSAPQDEVLDLSLRMTQTQTKQEVLSTASPDSALDLSTASSSARHPRHWRDLKSNRLFANDSTNGLFLEVFQPVKCLQALNSNDINVHAGPRQSTRYKWTMDESNGKDIKHSKYEAYKGRIVSSTQTVKVIVSATETIPASLCDKLRGFSGISSAVRADSRLSKTQPVFSGTNRRVLKDKPVSFKRGRVQDIHGNNASYKKQHLDGYRPGN